MTFADKLNENSKRLAKGITDMPFYVPQFYKDGGEVDLFRKDTYPNNQGLAQRLPQAGNNAATQSENFRFQMDKQGKSYMPKPDPYRVNLGQNAAFTAPTNIKPVGPTLIDSNMAAGIANNAANLYQGPYKEQVMSMFPKPQYKEGGEVDPTESGGYGLIQGEGTGKSDEIDATLNQQDYILPIETVDMVGRQWLDDLVARIMGDEQGEMEDGMEGEMEDKQPMAKTPEVKAMVSNQEYRVPAEVVEELGVEFFDKLKELSGVPDLSKTVDGKPAYASGDQVDEEQKRKASLIDPQANNQIAGIPDVIGGIKSAANSVNNFFNTSDATSARGDQRPPGYQAPQLNNQNTTGQNQFNNELAKKNPDVFSYGTPSNSSPSLNNGINRPSNPNIYGRNGENLGPNPSREQVNSLFNPQPKQNGLEQYKDYLSAQVDARNRDRINQAFYGQPGDANIDARSAFEPQALENAYNIASNANLADLTKANLAANVEREKATSPTFNARLDDAGNRFIYQESGAGAPEYNSNINYQSEPTSQDQPQQKSYAQRSRELLDDPTFKDESIRKKARDYLVSLGYKV